MKTLLVLFSGILLVNFPSTKACGRGSMYIKNNEYHNMLIAISETVDEDEVLITRIKEVFTNASELLYQATRKRAFLKTITLLIPGHWTGIQIDNIAVNETHDQSEIVIDHPEPGQDDTPFTVKPTSCGKPGHYTRYTPNYLKNEAVGAKYGPYNKVIVHEFAHLRYGVYDEYPSENGGNHVYPLPNGEYTGTRCSAAIPGYLYNTQDDRDCRETNGMPEEDCRWVDEQTDVVGNYSSLMYRQNLDYVVEFCDNEKGPSLHNRDAPTHQNVQCFGKSIWEIMREHPDFCDGNNPPRPVEMTVPTFRIVRQQQKRTVLVLDISGSMRGEKIKLLAQACTNYISHTIRDGESLGIVWFSSGSAIKEELTVINDDTKPKLLQSVPRTTSGNTAIGKGILDGLKVLAGPNKERGGSMIVVSDGGENEAPFIADVTEDVRAAEVVVHSIAITDDAESAVDALTMETKGLQFYFCTTCESNGLNEAFETISNLNISPDQQKFTLESFSTNISPGQTNAYEVTVDPTLGNNTEIIFGYQAEGIKFTIIAPSEKVFTEESTEVENNNIVFTSRLTLKEASGVGSWSYSIKNTNKATQRVDVSIKSMGAKQREYPILAQAFWGEGIMNLSRTIGQQVVYASVSKGYAPVLRAKVVADIEKPDSSLISFSLLDNGVGADKIANDGVYSAYFLGFEGNGRYGLSVRVTNVKGTVVSGNRVVGSSAAAHSRQRRSIPDSPTGKFVRKTAGGSFGLIGFVPGQKIYEPGRVTDLKVIDIDFENQLVTLNWTSVGEQLTNGTASAYEIRYGTEVDGMYDDFNRQMPVTNHMVQGNLSTPLEPGLEETLIVKVPTGGDISYVFGLRVWDYEGRNVSGPVSNIAIAALTPFVGIDDSGSTNLALVIGLTFGAVVVLLIIIAVVVAVISKKCKTKTGNTQNGHINKAYGV